MFQGLGAEWYHLTLVVEARPYLEVAARRRLQRSFVRRLWTGVRHRTLGSADVPVAAYPKSGSTWLRFLLAEAVTGRTADFQSVGDVIPYVGKQRGAPHVLPSGGRLVKTHEPYRPEYRTSVYLVRDIRDVVVSYYYMYRWLRYYRGTL